MSGIMLGVICGLLFGAVDIGIMLPMGFSGKTAAITAAFIAHFGIGFVIGAVRIAVARMGSGIDFRASAWYSRRYHHERLRPIIGMGAIGGTIIGVIIGRFGC